MLHREALWNPVNEIDALCRNGLAQGGRWSHYPLRAGVSEDLLLVLGRRLHSSLVSTVAFCLRKCLSKQAVAERRESTYRPRLVDGHKFS
jgi:hypothetical protein